MMEKKKRRGGWMSRCFFRLPERPTTPFWNRNSPPKQNSPGMLKSFLFTDRPVRRATIKQLRGNQHCVCCATHCARLAVHIFIFSAQGHPCVLLSEGVGVGERGGVSPIHSIQAAEATAEEEPFTRIPSFSRAPLLGFVQRTDEKAALPITKVQSWRIPFRGNLAQQCTYKAAGRKSE